MTGFVKEWVLNAPVYEPRDYPEGVVRLDLNEHPGPVPRFIVEAVAGEAWRANRYPERILYERLYSLLEDYTGVKRSLLVFGAGSDSLLRAVFEAVVRPGDRVVLLEPSFSMYPVFASVTGARVETVRLKPCRDKWCVDLAELTARGKGARLLVIDNPNNPTGSLLLTPKEVGELAVETGALIVVDEAYYEYSGCTAVELVEETGRVIVARTFSKAFGLAGLRIGYLAAPREVREAVWRLTGPFPLPRTSLAAAIAALEHRSYFLSRVRETVELREWLREKLGSIGVKAYKSWANFVLVNTNVENVVDRLAEKRIMVRRVPMGSSWARISVGARWELELLLEKLSELLAGNPAGYAPH